MNAHTVALTNQQDACYQLAEDLVEVSEALRRISVGRARPADVVMVRGVLDAHGDLVVRGQLDWTLLLRHAVRDPNASGAAT